MRVQRGGLVPLAIGLALAAAGMLGLRLSAGSPPLMNIVQPPASYLRNAGLRSAHLFPGMRALAVYTFRAPNFTREDNGASGTDSQVLTILGSSQGAVLAISEAAGPQLFASAQDVNEMGWTTVLPPSAHPVARSRVAALPSAESIEVSAWLQDQKLGRARIAVWPFPDDVLVVATAGDQSTARLFPSAGPSVPLLGGDQNVTRANETEFFLTSKK